MYLIPYDYFIILFILFLIALIRKDWKLLILLIIIKLFLLYFYRFPVLKLDNLSPLDILSPAYGHVNNIQYSKNKIIISIVLTIFDIHAQYIPYDGKIIKQKYVEGKHNMLGFNMDNNEKNSIMIGTDRGQIEVIQYAGMFVSKVSSFVRRGDKVERGQLYGFISFGSRVDIILPRDKTKIYVKVGQKVGGNVIGKFI